MTWFQGVVETSLNVGVVKMSDDRVQIICLVRSLIESGKSSVVSMLTSLAALSGADIVAEGGYRAGSRMQTLRSCIWSAKPISSCLTKPRTSW